jgi:hypothetical protein
MVMEELLELSRSQGEVGSWALNWPLDCGFNPSIQPQVLRLSKSIHTLGSTILHHSNKWIIFDMDCAHLLLSWAKADLRMIIVDPESTQALPSSMMGVRIRLYIQESGYARAICLDWPSALPQRQTILVTLDDLPKFLELLCITELANSVRVMPGQSFLGFGSTGERTAIRGIHGLSMCIHVDSSYRQSEVTSCLDHFRISHGPLNELSIIGAPNEEQAQDIEASTFALRYSEFETTFSELLILVVRLITLANIRIDQRHLANVATLFEQARAMVFNSFLFDKTPYVGGVSSDNAHESLFELLITILPGAHWMLHDIVRNNFVNFADAAHAIGSHLCPLTTMLVEQDGLEAEIGAHIILINGLHCIFSSYVNDRMCIEIIRHGMDLIDETQALVQQMPQTNTILFRTALKMCEMLRLLDEGSGNPTFMEVATTFQRWFKTHMKFIKLRVHESHISQTLRAKGILAMMTKESLPLDAKFNGIRDRQRVRGGGRSGRRLLSPLRYQRIAR